MTFRFFRYRFHFRALDPVVFPRGKSANVLRGAFGTLLRASTTPAEYTRLFRPGRALQKSPSGLADWPRPFIFRASHLDGAAIPAGAGFFVDAHVFDLRNPVLPHFQRTFEQLAVQGLGPGRGRAQLERVEQLDLEDGAAEASDPQPLSLSFEADPRPSTDARIQFLTPTELKAGSHVIDRPEFCVLFGRLRDRIATLATLYGGGANDLDYRGLGERAGRIRLAECDLAWAHLERKSGRTGQTHPLGGFTGTAAYEGDLAEFLPWLRAGRWVGVGRQTVWGKGDIRVLP